jgi:GTP-binding protein
VTRVPAVAVVGRQNVGKSTLVNRLFGARRAIADDTPGVTRDRIELETTWRGRRIGLVDTAGFVRRASGLEARGIEQADRALREADAVLLVVDGSVGVTEEDADLARRLRGSPVPVLVVANKVDTQAEEHQVGRLVRLGLGDPVPVSALHGRGTGDLLDRLVALLPEAPTVSPADRQEPRFAIVGRPNVGKSTLFNALIGDERAVVSEVPGTTRDAVDSIVSWPGHGPIRFVDTAGIRRGGKVRGIEYFGYVRATQAIEAADAVLLVLDATEGLSGEDKRIARAVLEAGRGLLVVANKWDLVQDKDATFKDLVGTLGAFASAPVVRVSATRGAGVRRLAPTLLDLRARWLRRVPTAAVNELLQAAQAARPLPRGQGKLLYGTQVAAGPPTFVFFGVARAPDAGYSRYLENRLRATFAWDGVPIRLRFRRGRPRRERVTRRR